MPYFSKLYQTELPHRAKLVYIYLHDRMDKEKKAWPGIKTIAADLSLSRSTVKRAIKDLEKAALIRKEPHYRENGSATSNRYYLLEIIFLRQGRSLPVRGPRKVVMTLWGEDEQRSERAFAVLRRNERGGVCDDEVTGGTFHDAG